MTFPSFFSKMCKLRSKVVGFEFAKLGGEFISSKDIYFLTFNQNSEFTFYLPQSWFSEKWMYMYIYIYIYSFPFMVQWGDFPLNHDLWDKRVTYTPEIRPCKRVFCAEYVFVKLFL